jgi:glycogen synthase
MRILLTNRLYHPVLGGTVVLTDSIAAVLVELGYEIRITTKTQDLGLETCHFFVSRTSSFVEICKQILWSDGVVMIEPSVFYASAAWLMRKPRMGLLQTWFLAHPSDLNLLRRLQKVLTHAFSRYSAPSQAVADNWGSDYEIIPNGYDPEIFYNEQIDKEYDFVFLGRFNLEKGPDLFVSALKYLHLKKIRFKALLIGDGETMPLCKKIALEANGLSEMITFKGEIRNRSEIAQLMNRCKVIVIPNRWDEPFGMVALEGLACGCRPVITRSGALEEVCGGYAVTVDKDNSKVLAEGMSHEMNLSPYDSNAVNNYLEKFHWKSLVKRYLDLMSSPMSEKCHSSIDV